jgi:hypothetical protein
MKQETCHADPFSFGVENPTVIEHRLFLSLHVALLFEDSVLQFALAETELLHLPRKDSRQWSSQRKQKGWSALC